MNQKKANILSIVEKILLLSILFILLSFLFSTMQTLKNVDNLSASSFSLYDILFIKVLFYSILEILACIGYAIVSRKMRKNNQITTLHKFGNMVRKRVPQTIAIILLFAFALFAAIIYYGQEMLMFYPTNSKESNTYLSKRDSYEKILITGKNGERYSGWLHKNENSKKTILYCGGNAQSSAATMRDYDMDKLWDSFLDYNFLMIDYPGYGESEGKPSEKTIFSMMEQVYAYVNGNDTLNEQIIIMGFSIGTGPAVYISSKYNVDGLILLAPYDEARSLYNRYINIFHGPFSSFIRNPFKSKEYAKQVKTVPLIIASKDDEVIPYELSVNLAKSFKQIPTFITMEGLHHNEILSDSMAIGEIQQYLTKIE
ncbi:MAG: alpha/beta hydrolase [Lachnospiraceae bacterium]|nr:alpha/beta hydrolase [Lachnospiraceae bacterium]